MLSISKEEDGRLKINWTLDEEKGKEFSTVVSENKTTEDVVEVQAIESTWDRETGSFDMTMQYEVLEEMGWAICKKFQDPVRFSALL